MSKTTKMESDLLPKEKPSDKGFDIIFDYIPSSSCYQTAIIICGLFLEFPSGAIQLASNILQAEPDVIMCGSESYCNGNAQGFCAANATDGCPANIATASCGNLSYSMLHFESTVVTEWDLVCNRSYINSNVQSYGLCGLFFGALIFGYLGDRIGRKKSMLLSCAGAVVFSLATAFLSVNVLSYSIWRFLAGLFIHGSVPLNYVYTLEFVPSEQRSLVTGFGMANWDLGVAALSLIAYWSNSWRWMAIGIALTPTPFFLMYFFIPESIQYLYTSGKSKLGLAEIKRVMARTNRTPTQRAKIAADAEALSDELIILTRNKASEAQLEPSKVSTAAAFVELFSADFILVTLQSFAILFSATLVCYGFLLNPASLSGNLLVNNAAMSLFEAAGFILFAIIGNKTGRVRLLYVGFAASGMFIISGLFIPRHSSTNLDLLANIIVFIGKTMNALVFGCAFAYIPELFPTHLRSWALGSSSAMARIGGLLAPQILRTKLINPNLPAILLGLVSLFGAVVSFFMPETSNKPLMQTSDEAKIFFSEHRSKTNAIC